MVYYVVPRTAEVMDLVQRIKNGRYIVIFAPRQTGKTTFFRWALERLTAEDPTYLPIQLDFETYRNISVERFYAALQRDIREEIVWQFQQLEITIKPELQRFLEKYPLKDHDLFQSFLKELSSHLDKKVTNCAFRKGKE